jgi:uncharacterized protein (DUF2147 family)
MKRLLAVAALLLASSAAQAQYQFEYGGKTIRIDPDRGTISIPGVYDNTKKAKRAKGDAKNDAKGEQDAPHNKSVTDPQTAPAPAETAAAPPPLAPSAPPAPPPPATATTAPDQQPATTANSAPSDTVALPPPPAPPPARLPPVQQSAAPPAPPPPPAPTVAAAPPVAPAPAQQRGDPNSPLGVWQTEEKEGKIRIEQCGGNLCGYAVDAKSNANGDPVLKDMRPGAGKWSGRITDPKSGSTYDSTLAMKGPDTLRVQGCAFGGMFCGGQTWTRVN